MHVSPLPRLDFMVWLMWKLLQISVWHFDDNSLWSNNPGHWSNIKYWDILNQRKSQTKGGQGLIHHPLEQYLQRFLSCIIMQTPPFIGSSRSRSKESWKYWINNSQGYPIHDRSSSYQIIWKDFPFCTICNELSL